MAENKQLLGGLYVQDQYDVNGDPESVSTRFYLVLPGARDFMIFNTETT